jgi:hypothetical protein
MLKKQNKNASLLPDGCGESPRDGVVHGSTLFRRERGLILELKPEVQCDQLCGIAKLFQNKFIM